MTSVWARLPAVITAVLAFAACPASSSILRHGSETSLPLAPDANTRYHNTWLDPIPGTEPLFGRRERTLDLGKRDCLANGSNYCFGNDVDFCPGCGNCCVDGEFCCGADQISVVWETTTAVARRAATCLQPQPSKGGNQAQQPHPIEGRGTSISTDPTPIPRKAREEATPTTTDYVTETVDTTSISSIMITVHTTSTEVTTVYQTNTHVLKAETTTTITSTITVTSKPPTTVTLTETASIIPSPTASETNQPTSSSSTAPNPLPTPAIAGIAAGGSVLALLLAGFIILSIRRRCGGAFRRSGKRRPSADSATLDYFQHQFHQQQQHHHHYPLHSDEDATLYPGTGTVTGTATANRSRSSTHTGAGAGTRTSTGARPSLGSRQPTLPRVLPQFATATAAAAAHHDAEYTLPASATSPAFPTSPTTTTTTTPGTGAGGGAYKAGGGYLTANPDQYQQYQQYHQYPHHHHPHHHQSHERNESGLTTLVGTPSPTSPGFAVPAAGGKGGVVVVEEEEYGYLQQLQLQQKPKPTPSPTQQVVGMPDRGSRGGLGGGGGSPGSGWVYRVEVAEEVDGGRRLGELGSGGGGGGGGGGGVGSVGGGARQRAYSSPSAAAVGGPSPGLGPGPGPVVAGPPPRVPAWRYQRSRAATVGELAGDAVEIELDGNGVRRG
ncbi:hypothetical protein CHGG_01482 [Chaetomium globosum CBS 148.51]|uniref:Uncharacterized protein n=1 Tax=Chaetomium globosum (strain ATCC 6205 / CBS 148.51 / DSM 1962 / NBRC 6347 / NRRL 1970) TaxID=306901 RepID=Q2HE72_CHAGB|nr:uncharacterized protein CHGG_01482 [Chaetomium globosum CBS 148.51]EAQ93247.1 hypothetical protein CHGG_01482 [Chaetomium globosum CBS 148.51]